MALPLDYRWVLVGRMAMRNRANAPHFAPRFEVGDVISALRDRLGRQASHRPYANNSRLMWCSDVIENADYYVVMLQVGDKNVSGVSYVDFQTLNTRDIDKADEEGSHFSSHVLIGRTPDQQGRYPVLIEKVPGVHLASVKDHLGWACREPRYAKEVEDGEGNVRAFNPVFEIDGYQSKTIREALRTGTLQDVQFISHEENHEDGLDEDPLVQDVVHQAHWQIKRRVTEDQARTVFGRIGGFIRDFRGGVDTTQVFVRIKAENGQIRATEVSPVGDEILEQAFVQNEVVRNFDRPLTQRYNEFRNDMIQKMSDLARNLGG
ncbi:hypothetical protein SAMN05421641_12443 [Paracoccus thiocyanatus]|uniref:Uncharacterized protein n=1 Tax=Paracoccus thiocyanatus TaxID=34006 RepID=A0A1N6Y449_9RHOB|nr:hypothetical protein [Paracoccus thiocyanatus]SIR09402.1 hypothetical protein SAMN05421641_12443 [Paracoccus thiocyanatus]